MTTILFANIGNSDLRIDGKRPLNPRNEGETAWTSFDDHQFELAIIEPCMREILHEQDSIIDRVVLFYTNQPVTPESMQADRFGVALRDKDTIWFARIIERALKERFAEHIGEVLLVPIERADGRQINPSMPDEAFDVFGQLVPRWCDATVERGYVLMSGGLPACNNALQLHALTCLGDRCAMWYKPENHAPFEQRVGAQLQQTFRRNAAVEALDRLNFAAALALADGAASEVIELLKFLVFREAFDFTRARQALRSASQQASGELRPLLGTLRNELEALEQHEMTALLRELVWNAEIAFRNERYADFLGRIFRLQESTLRYVVETWLHIPTDIGKDYDVFLRAVQAHPPLEASLQRRTFNNRPLRYETPSIPVLGACLEYMLGDGTRLDGTPCLRKPERGRFEGLKRALNEIEKLTQLRNQSVIAHGFAGVSRQALDAACGGDAHTLVLPATKKILALLGITNDPSLAPLTAIVRMRLQRGER